MPDDMQRSTHVPVAEDYMVQVDLDLACPFCMEGRVVVQSPPEGFDFRRKIAAYCENPECGDPKDIDKGREVHLRVHSDGTFRQWENTADLVVQSPQMMKYGPRPTKES